MSYNLFTLEYASIWINFMENNNNLLQFFVEVGKLKRLPRTGWLRRGIANPETVAEHSFRLAIMALFLAEKLKLNRDRCVQLALIHDVAESQIGDLTPSDPITPEQKICMETVAIEKLSQLIDTKESSLLVLWREYIAQKTLESRFIAQLDKLEMVLQASEYENADQTCNLEEFWGCTKTLWTFSELKMLYNLLYQQRKIIPI